MDTFESQSLNNL